MSFNILAPGVVQDHVTLGLTNTLQSGNEWSMSFMYAFNEEVSGTSVLPAFAGGVPGGTETIEMYQWALGVQYSWKM
jgi:long-chain fatty acid transport protein